MTSNTFEVDLKRRVARDNKDKDRAARRTLKRTFINMAVPLWSERDGMEDLFDVGQDLIDFKKSSGIWYRSAGEDKFWDRRLVLWIRDYTSKKGLQFIDTRGNPVLYNGEPLREAGICTLEIVLRNQASYSIGFLLQPKNEGESLEEASSWRIIAYFPFPRCDANCFIPCIKDCVTDEYEIKKLLLANPRKGKSKGKGKGKGKEKKEENNCDEELAKMDDAVSCKRDDQCNTASSCSSCVDDDDDDDSKSNFEKAAFKDQTIPQPVVSFFDCKKTDEEMTDHKEEEKFDGVETNEVMVDSSSFWKDTLENDDMFDTIHFCQSFPDYIPPRSPSLFCYPDDDDDDRSMLPIGSPLESFGACSDYAPEITFGGDYGECVMKSGFTWEYDKCAPLFQSNRSAWRNGM